MLAGETTPEEGTVALSPPDATVGLLPQEPERRPGETVAAFLARRTGVADAQAAMDAAADGAGRGRRCRTTPTPSRSTAGSPSAAPTSTSARARWPPTSGSASRWTCR